LLIRWPWQNNHGRKTKDQKGSLKLYAKPLSMLKGKFGCKNKEKVECTLLISLYRLFVHATSWYGFGNSYIMYVVIVRDSPQEISEMLEQVAHILCGLDVPQSWGKMDFGLRPWAFRLLFSQATFVFLKFNLSYLYWFEYRSYLLSAHFNKLFW
jgi:hypothetical protein